MPQIGNLNISLKKNLPQDWDERGQPESLCETACRHLGTEEGQLQLTQLNEKLCKFLEVTTDCPQEFKGAAKIFQNAMAVLGLYSLSKSAGKMGDSIVDLYKHSIELSSSYFKRITTAIRSVATTVSILGCSSAPFIQLFEKTSEVSGKVFSIAKSTKTVADVCSFVENSQAFWKARSVSIEVSSQKEVSSDIENAATAEYRLSMMKLTKVVCSLASAVLGLSAVSASLATVPAYAAGVATLSLLGTMLGIGATLYADQITDRITKAEFLPLAHDKRVIA